MMTTRVENITQSQAKKYLAKNAHNRPIKRAAVEEYKREMLAGRWVLMHQGIAFYSTGELFDGQNRLTAIAECGVAVQMNVTRGVPRKGVIVNGAEITPQDVTDSGRKRSVGDQLYLHGYTNTNLASAAARTIGHICAGSCKGTFPMGPATAVLSLYGGEIDSAISLTGNSSATRRGATLGALAFALAGCGENADRVKEFAVKLATGDSISRGAPVFALRRLLVESPLYRSSGRGSTLAIAEAVLFAVHLTLQGRSVERLYIKPAGLSYFAEQQAERVTKVRAIMGAE